MDDSPRTSAQSDLWGEGCAELVFTRRLGDGMVGFLQSQSSCRESVGGSLRGCVPLAGGAVGRRGMLRRRDGDGRTTTSNDAGDRRGLFLQSAGGGHVQGTAG